MRECLDLLLSLFVSYQQGIDNLVCLVDILVPVVLVADFAMHLQYGSSHNFVMKFSVLLIVLMVSSLSLLYCIFL